MRQQGGGGSNILQKSCQNAKLRTKLKTTFADVAGCDEAKEEVGAEIVDFLRIRQIPC